ncbi:MAG: MFS transporter [Xenococcaceae cyanobacterium MO_207.B15]|nr:MFS transporter [Xenococcaceae cyanobacterium MO_207.B15]
MNVLQCLKPETQRNLAILFFTGLLFWISITTLLPTLPAYIQDVGGTPKQVGLVMGCFAIGLLSSRTWLGKLADRRSRKLVILIGSTVAGTAPIGYIFVQFIPGLAAIRAFHGISIAAFTIGYSALAIDFAPRQHRGKIIGYMNLAVPMGMSIGPALGGFLQASLGYKVLFLVCASCGILALLLGSRLRDKMNRKTVGDRLTKLIESTRSFQELTHNSALVTPAVVLFLVGSVFGTLVAFLPLYVRELDFSLNIGLFYTTIAIASFIVRLFVGEAADRYGRGVLITISLIFYIVSMVFLANADNSVTLLLAAIAEGCGAGILIPTILALISDRSYENERGRVYALCLGGFDVGIAVAGPILGLLEASFGYQGIFSLATILSAIALFIFITRSSRGLSHSIRFSLGQEKDIYAVDLPVTSGAN